MKWDYVTKWNYSSFFLVFFFETLHHLSMICQSTLCSDDRKQIKTKQQILGFICWKIVKRAIQYWLDKSTIHVVPRWIGFVVLLLLFFLRVYLVQGYFIVAYGLGIFLLNNFIAFLSPLEDPTDTGPGLPTTESEGKEFRPFARRLPEFKFWLHCTRGTATCIVMTFFSFFDIPVFWPILLMYFFVLFFMTMKRQIMHMYKHKYVPISFGKSKYKDAGVERGMYGGGMSKGK